MINEGDTIVTSGYSSIFPKGVMIGYVENISKPEGDNFYEIDLELSTNFNNLSFVYVVNNLRKDEQIKLENTVIESD